MALKNPLVTKFSDDSRQRGKDTVLTAYAAGNLFTGATLADSTDLNTVLTPGIVKINNTIVNGPPLTDPTGFLQVLREQPESDGEAKVIRQIVYPDSLTEPAPYTRVGKYTGSSWSFGEWSTLGGGMVFSKLQSDNTALPNIMYYSFGNHTLTLPNPAIYNLGTKCGLYQMAGVGSVAYTSADTTYTVATEPAKDDAGVVTSGVYYMFEIGANDDTGVHEWQLLVDEDGSAAVAEWRTKYNDLLGAIATRARGLVHVSAVTNTEVTLNQLAASDYRICCRTTGLTIVIPNAAEVYTKTAISQEMKIDCLNAKIIIELIPGTKVTVVEADLVEEGEVVAKGESEIFIAPTDSGRVLPFELSYTGVGAQWVKLITG